VGWGQVSSEDLGGNLNGVAPAASTSKYRHALERSGNPKDTGEIMMESRNSRWRLAIGGRHPGLKI
jgi:hypothetical protein